MNRKLKRTLGAGAALAALALGGAGIAGATGDDGSEAKEGKDAPSLQGTNADKARAAAEQAIGGKAGEVQPREGGGDDAPAKTAYEVDVDKGGKNTEVFVDSNFRVLESKADDE